MSSEPVEKSPGIRLNRSVWERAIKAKGKAQHDLMEALSSESWFSALILEGLKSEKYRKYDER